MFLVVDTELRRLDFLTILNVEAANVHEITCVSVVVSDELRDNSERLCGIHAVTRALAKECFVPKSVRVQVTARLVAETARATILLILATLGSFKRTRMRCVGSRLRVCLPNVHLCAARAILAHGSLRIPRTLR